MGGCYVSVEADAPTRLERCVVGGQLLLRTDTRRLAVFVVVEAHPIFYLQCCSS